MQERHRLSGGPECLLEGAIPWTKELLGISPVAIPDVVHHPSVPPIYPAAGAAGYRRSTNA